MSTNLKTEMRERRRPPSFFGPVLLIAAGVFLLLGELNLVANLHWGDLLRLWPLYLIFLGLNLLVLQAPRPLGTIFSALIALAAVGVAAFVLLLGLPGSIGGAIDLGAWQTEAISFPAGDVTSAVVDVAIGPPGADVYALEDSNDLIAGTVTYRDALRFDRDSEDGRATIRLARDDDGPLVWLPGPWRDGGDDGDGAGRWDLGLSPDVPLSLSLRAAAGSSELDLRRLTLDDLSVEVAAGEVALSLPDGDYDAEIATSAGATAITLPREGEQQIEINVAAGSVELRLPAGMEARVEVDQAVGNFDNERADLQRVETSNVWQTPGYEESADRVTILVDVAVGSVTLR